MKDDLSGLINIGKDTRKKLEQVGIKSFSQLKEAGSEGAFLKLQTIDPGACISLLYGLEGALCDTKWNNLPVDKKKSLLEFYNMVKKK